MMRSLKKFIAVACSVALMVSSGVTAFAEAPSTTAGTGNMLAYSLESVIVPTTVKVALNPAGYTVTIRDTGDETTSTAQVVSFNYGMANKSTANKVVKVELKVTGTADTEKTPITFVATEKEAEEYNATSNADGAKPGELKMYLALVGGSAAPQTLAGEDFEVTEVTGGANTENAVAGNLGDVKMTVASSGAVVFSKTDSEYAFAETAFSLGKATYDVLDNTTIDFTTTQEQLKTKMEMTELGEVAGFTITGKMNPDADWTKADVSALSFAPIYSLSDATGEEVAAGGYKQVKTTPATYTVTYNANYVADGADAAETATETVNTNAHPTGTGDEVVALKTREGYTFKFWGASATATEAADLEEISAATTLYAIWEQNSITGYVEFDSEWTFWFGLNSTTGWDADPTITSLTIDGHDVTSDVVMKTYGSKKWPTVTWAKATAAGVEDKTTGSYSCEMVTDAGTYVFELSMD